MSTHISLSLDLGRSGKTAFCVVAGKEWDRLKMIHLSAISSISAPDVEKILLDLYARYNPGIIIMESNGPGGVFAEFAMLHNPSLPLWAIDVGEPPLTLYLWDDLQMNDREYVNVRAEEYFIVRYLFRSGKLKLNYEDVELFAQLTATYWDADRTRNDKIRLMPKKSMKMSDFASELEGVQLSRSPDKADALALACLGYTILMQDQANGKLGPQEDEFILPEEGFEGVFNLSKAGIELMTE